MHIPVLEEVESMVVAAVVGGQIARGSSVAPYLMQGRFQFTYNIYYAKYEGLFYEYTGS